MEDSVKKESDVFATIERINKKLSALDSVLSPIINSVPKNTKEQGYGTKLSNDLHNIEDKITSLLDSINL